VPVDFRVAWFPEVRHASRSNRLPTRHDPRPRAIRYEKLASDERIVALANVQGTPILLLNSPPEPRPLLRLHQVRENVVDLREVAFSQSRTPHPVAISPQSCAGGHRDAAQPAVQIQSIACFDIDLLSRAGRDNTDDFTAIVVLPIQMNHQQHCASASF
jgi:hypothetical protein